MKIDTKKRALIAGLTLIIPLAALSIGFLSLGDIERPDNYTSYLLRDISANGDGAVAHWVDYSGGEGDVIIKELDGEGYLTGDDYRIHHDGKDSFRSTIERVGDHLVVFYLTTVLDIEEARFQEETWVELNILTLDADTLQPEGRYEEGKVLGEFQIEWIYNVHFKSGDRMYCQYDMESLGFSFNEDLDVIYRDLELEYETMEDVDLVVTNSTLSKINPDRFIITVGEDLEPSIMLVDFHVRHMRICQGNGEGIWGGLDIILYEHDHEEDLRLGVVNMGSHEEQTWKLPGGFPGDDFRAVTTDEGVFLTTEEFGLAHFSREEKNGTFREFPMDMVFQEGRDIKVLQDGNVIALWQGNVIGEAGDAMYMVILDNRSEVVTNTLLDDEVTRGRLAILDNGNVLGIGSSGGSMNYELVTFQIINGKLYLRETLTSTGYGGVIFFMVMAFFPFILGFAAFIINMGDVRLKQYKKMTESQLQLFNEKVLGKALGKKAIGMNKDEMIEEILKPSQMEDVSKEEERRRMRFVIIPFVYFALIGVGMAAIFAGLILDQPVKPAFFSGYSNIIEVILLSFALAVLLFLLLGEWGQGKKRNAAILLMGTVQGLGQLFLLLFIIIAIVPEIGYSVVLQFFMIMVPGIMFLGLFGPFLIILDRKKKNKMWAFLPMFAWYLVTSLGMLTALLATSSFVPVGTGRFLEAMFFTDFEKVFTYMITGMLGGAVIQSWITMNDIKPSDRWSVKELMRMRTAPMIMAHIVNIALGIAFFVMGMGIPLNFNDGTNILIVVISTLVIAGLGGALYAGGIVMIKNLKKDTKNLNQGMMMAYFTPLLTTITGMLAALMLSVIGPIIFTLAAAGQILYADKVVRETFQVLPFNLKKEKEKKDTEKMKEIKRKKEQARGKKTKMLLPEKLFYDKLKKNLRGYWILLLVMIVLGLLAAMYGKYLPQLDLLKGLLPDTILAICFVLVCAPLFIMVFYKLTKLNKEESPLKLANAGILGPLIVTTMLSLLLVGVMMESAVIFLLISALYGVPYMISVRIYQDNAKKRFKDLPREKKMIYPAEMVAFKAGAMGVTDPTILERSPEELKRDLQNSKPADKDKKKGKKKNGTRKDVPEKDDRGQVLRGQYLFMETPRLQKARTAGVKKGGVIIIILAVSCFLLSMVGVVVGSICGIFTTVMMGVIGLIFAPLGIVILLGKGGKETVKFYKWGVVDHSLLGAKEIYIPYGNLKPAGEKTIPEIGKVQLLKAQNISTIWLPMDRSPYMELHSRIQEYFANEDHLGYIENNAGNNAKDVVMPIVSLVLSIVGAIAMAAMLVFLQDLSLKMGILTFASAFLILNLTLGNRSKKQENLDKKMRILRPEKKGIDLKMNIMAVSMVVGLLIAGIGLAVALLVPGSVMTMEIQAEDLPSDYEEMIWFDDGVRYNVDTNLAVLKGQEVKMKDSSFLFEGSFNDPGMFYVQNGGSVVLDNVSFMSKGQSKVMSVEIHGNSEFNNCLFEGIWADSSETNGQGGVEVHSADVTFRNCTFVNGSFNLLMLVDSDVELIDCTFMNAGDDAIEVQGSDLKMSGCHIENVDWVMISVDGSDVEISDTTITHTNYGIANSWSSLKVTDSSFDYIEHYAISSGFGADLEESGNVYDSVGEEVMTDMGFEEMMFGTCAIIPFVIGILGLIYAVIMLRKRKKELEKK